MPDSEPLDLEALREVVDAATDLPWESSTYGLDMSGSHQTYIKGSSKPGQVLSARVQSADAALIVAAVNALPVLIDEVQRLGGMQVHIEERIGEPTTCLVTHKGIPLFFGQNYGPDKRAEKAEAEVARLTAVVQGVREIADRCDEKPTADYIGPIIAQQLRAVLAGGTDTPKDAETERTDQ